MLGPALETNRRELDTAVAQLVEFRLEQAVITGLARQETANLAALRHEIYANFGSPIRAVAEARLRDVPDYEMLLLPSRAKTHGEFLAKAVSLADAAAKHETFLGKAIMRPNFLSELRSAIARYFAMHDSRARHLSRKSAARAGIAAADKAARKVIGLLDGALTPLFRDDPGLLADWKTSCRIHKTPVDPSSTGDITD